MALKNYTSQVSASRSISHIEDVLVGHGASQVLKKYDGKGRVSAVAFIIAIEGVEMPFKLPARVAECEKVLRSRLKKPTSETFRRIAAQSERTAWKIISDWVDAQMAMVELAQINVMEVFLPYVYDAANDRTYYQVLEARGLGKLLPACAESFQTSPRGD